MLCSAFGFFANVRAKHTNPILSRSNISFSPHRKSSILKSPWPEYNWTEPVKWLLGPKSPERNSLPHTHTTTRGGHRAGYHVGVNKQSPPLFSEKKPTNYSFTSPPLCARSSDKSTHRRIFCCWLPRPSPLGAPGGSSDLPRVNLRPYKGHSRLYEREKIKQSISR
jgi:hypothetical protein